MEAIDFSNPVAEQHLSSILIQRRDKIARAYLTSVNPLVDPKLSAGGDLTFANAATAAGVAEAPSGYVARWARFDNASGDTQSIGESRSAQTSIKAPRDLPSAPGDIVQIDVAGDGAGHPEWQHAVRLHFRRAADGWTLVGLDRSAR